MRAALPSLALFLTCLTACSEDRSDIENLEAKVLEEEAAALSESAQEAVGEQVDQIQPMTIDVVSSNTENEKTAKE